MPGLVRPGQTRRQLKCAAVKWQDKRQDKTWAALDMHINCLKQSICCYFKRPWQSICRRWVDRPCCISDRQIGQLSRWAAWETGAERDKDRERESNLRNSLKQNRDTCANDISEIVIIALEAVRNKHTVYERCETWFPSRVAHEIWHRGSWVSRDFILH